MVGVQVSEATSEKISRLLPSVGYDGDGDGGSGMESK